MSQCNMIDVKATKRYFCCLSDTKLLQTLISLLPRQQDTTLLNNSNLHIVSFSEQDPSSFSARSLKFSNKDKLDGVFTVSDVLYLLFCPLRLPQDTSNYSRSFLFASLIFHQPILYSPSSRVSLYVKK